MKETYLEKGKSKFDMSIASIYHIIINHIYYLKSLFDMIIVHTSHIINISIYGFKWNRLRKCMIVRLSHKLWVYIGIFRGNTQNLKRVFILELHNHFLHTLTQSNNMGGEAKKIELENCNYW